VHDLDIRPITPGMLAEEEQHAERRTVHVFRLMQINDVLRNATRVLLIHLPKFLVHAKIETPADVDCHDLSI
jgi:hypothetical protein